MTDNARETMPSGRQPLSPDEENMLDVLAATIVGGLKNDRTDKQILDACGKAKTPRVLMPASRPGRQARKRAPSARKRRGSD